MKPFSLTEVRNLIHYTFSEMQQLGRHDPHSFKVGFLSGYICSKIETQEYSVPQLEAIYHKVADIVGEFVFKYDDRDEALNDADVEYLLKELQRELDHIDTIDALVGPTETEDEDVDDVLAEIEKEYQAQVKDIKKEEEEDKRIVAERKDFYLDIYQRICDYITSHYDEDVDRMESLEDKTWIPESEKAEEIGRIRRKIHEGADVKLRELLKDNPDEIRRFHLWLKGFDEGDDSCDWWKKEPK